MRQLLCLIAVLLLAGCTKPDPLPAKAGGPSWPRFQGPGADGVSTDTNLLKKWPEGGPKLLWTAKGIGEGYSSVTITDGRIYTAGSRGSRTVVSALDFNGTIAWQTPNGPAWTKDYPGTRGTPTVDGECVYHESPRGRLACLAKDGSEVWAVDILDEFEGENIRWGLAESVLVDGDRVICCPGGRKASVAALDKRTGETVWKAPDSGAGAGYASPILAECQGLRMILTMTAKALIGVNADTGELLFTHEHTTSYDVNATTPIYRDGKVLISSGYGKGAELLAIRIDGRSAGVERVWQTKDLDNHHGGIALWNRHVYGTNSHEKWVCLEWATGQRTYAQEGVGKGSLTIAEGMLYTLGESGEMGLVEAGPAAHNLVSTFSIPTAGQDCSWAYPVVCGGRLYIRHGNQLHAYQVADLERER